jgi:dihydropyrimidine dehydrogenase (NAD+) subunit PreA
MVPQETGKPYMNWTQDPRNPRAEIRADAAVAQARVVIEPA